MYCLITNNLHFETTEQQRDKESGSGEKKKMSLEVFIDVFWSLIANVIVSLFAHLSVCMHAYVYKL